MHGKVLIVAGSDSGGGAGIQADIKTVTALGGYAMTAVTALTAQNTLGVHGIFDVPPEFVARQMHVVLSDIGADCIKVGMLHRPEIVEAVCDVLKAECGSIPIVVDPVMMAKGGSALLAPEAMHALKTHLIPLARVLTPNLPEAEALAGGGGRALSELAAAVLDLGPQAVLLKGGHGDGPMLTDILAETGGAMEAFEGPRIDTPHTHGTGCTMASAVAAGLAQGMTLRSAVVRARAYVLEAISTAPGFGHGHGPLNHAHTARAFPET